MYKILIVEDDQTISESLCAFLKNWNYDVHIIYDFRSVIKDFIEFEPQLVLLDIILPYFNGYHWCQEIRKISKVPIIFLSSASDNMNIVMAVNLGGDDFIAKPFDLNVLLAKIQAMLRRVYSFQGSSSILEYNGTIINLGDSSITLSNNKCDLTKNEIKILQILVQNKGKTVTREDIMKFLWDSESFVDDNTLTVNITRLRKKLDSIGLCNAVLTKKGIGYFIRDE
jgi:DNA-binding response OmpR family regulator